MTPYISFSKEKHNQPLEERFQLKNDRIILFCYHNTKENDTSKIDSFTEFFKKSR